MPIDVEGSEDSLIIEGTSADYILLEGETPPDFTDYSLPDQIQQHYHTHSEDLIHLLESVQEVFHEDTIKNAQKIIELKNPEKTPKSFLPALEEMVGWSGPTINKTEEVRRRQLKEITEWIKIKGKESSLKAFFSSLDFVAETNIQLSDNYSNFLTEEEVISKFGTIPDGFFYTPHVELEFSTGSLIDGEILTQSNLDTIQNKLFELAPATTVFDFEFRIEGDAKEDKKTVDRNFVSGSVSDTYQSFNSEPFERCHRAGDGIEALRTFDYMDVENWDEWKIGTYSGDVKDFNSFDSILKSSTDFEIIPRPDIGETRVEATIGDDVSGTWNAIAFYDNGHIRALWKLDTDMSIFDESDTEVKFIGHIEESTPKWHFTSAVQVSSENKLKDESKNNYVFATSNFDFSWDREGIEAGWEFRFDTDLIEGEDDKRSYLAKMTQQGTWKAGELNGKDPSTKHTRDAGFLELQDGDEFNLQETVPADIINPVMDLCSGNFEVYNKNGFDQLVFELDLIQSPIFGNDIDQIGLYEPDGDKLFMIFQLDDPISVSDQYNRDKLKLTLDVS